MKIFVVLILAIAALIGITMLAERNAHPGKYEKEEPLTKQPNVPQTPPAVKKLPKATLEPGDVATVKTSKGDFKFVIFEKDMPITCKNFAELAKSGFYKGLKFHRVEDWVVQGGDPKGDGTGGSKKEIKLEIKDGLGFEVPYMVGMARKNEPDSASSQFFVTKFQASHIQGPETGGYACFGLVFEGSDVVPNIEINDLIKDVIITDASEQDKPKIKACIDKLKKAKKETPAFVPMSIPNNEEEHSH